MFAKSKEGNKGKILLSGNINRNKVSFIADSSATDTLVISKDCLNA